MISLLVEVVVDVLKGKGRMMEKVKSLRCFEAWQDTALYSMASLFIVGRTFLPWSKHDSNSMRASSNTFTSPGNQGDWIRRSVAKTNG